MADYAVKMEVRFLHVCTRRAGKAGPLRGKWAWPARTERAAVELRTAAVRQMVLSQQEPAETPPTDIRALNTSVLNNGYQMTSYH